MHVGKIFNVDCLCGMCGNVKLWRLRLCGACGKCVNSGGCVCVVRAGNVSIVEAASVWCVGKLSIDMGGLCGACGKMCQYLEAAYCCVAECVNSGGVMLVRAGNVSRKWSALCGGAECSMCAAHCNGRDVACGDCVVWVLGNGVIVELRCVVRCGKCVNSGGCVCVNANFASRQTLVSSMYSSYNEIQADFFLSLVQKP
ncbi:hypothetical protein HNY73_012649 [Argiope bruennichi]|uniref:Uncharacterized protein n=1 Tax=Argiope bruennichi TaxID=94029 RepID=A0A8T0EVL7_ARGBR|nr:hypothetical protein HNY73_012649 [Argiope bruennichi]